MILIIDHMKLKKQYGQRMDGLISFRRRNKIIMGGRGQDLGGRGKRGTGSAKERDRREAHRVRRMN